MAMFATSATGWHQLRKLQIWPPPDQRSSCSYNANIKNQQGAFWDFHSAPPMATVIDPNLFFMINATHAIKHSQRHNGPRVLSLKLELSLKLKWIQIQFSQKDNSSYRLNTLGPLCLRQCFQLFLDLFSTFSQLILNFFSTFSTFQVASLALVAPFEFISNLATRWHYLH